MKLRIVFLLIGSIFSYYSCTESNSEEIKPEFIFAKTIGVNDMDKTINIGDSIKLNIKYRIEDQDYSFNKLICTDLGSNSSYAEQFLIKVELIKVYEQRANEIDSVIWEYLPTKIGLYKIDFFNVEDPLMNYYFKVEYPTFNCKMETNDYQIIIDSVSNNPVLAQYLDSYGTAEYYFGASSRYKNFDLRISKRIISGQTEFESMTEEEAMEIIWERVISSLKIVLKANFPNANSHESFIIEFNTYNDDYTTDTYSAKFICSKIDNIKNFEFIEFI